jgi:hypothetical protein
MKGKQEMAKIIQKARLQNSADMRAVLAGRIKPDLDLYPNPTKRVLEGNPQFDGKMVTDLL